MSAMPNIIPISDLRQDAAGIIKRAAASDETRRTGSARLAAGEPGADGRETATLAFALSKARGGTL